MEPKKEKRGFLTEEDAREELIRIINTNYNTCKTVKPCRYYWDSEKGMWYLTSQPKVITYNFKK